jgi:hypothetical protein
MAGSEDQEPKTCFVVMPVTTPALYAEQSDDPDHFAHVLVHLFMPALESLGYQVILPSVTGSELIHAEIIKNLEQADLVLCDLSSLNPNVFFELGIRTALDRPIVLVRDSLTPQVPFDLAAINVFTYDGSLKLWVVKDEVTRLTSHIKATAKSTSGTGNPMWRYFGLTQRAGPAEIENPVEAKLDLILSELTKLNQRSVIETTSTPTIPRGFRFRRLVPVPMNYEGVSSMEIYDIGIALGIRIKGEVSNEWLESLLSGKPNMPESLRSRIILDSSLPPDLLRNPRVLETLVNGFWVGLGAEKMDS